MANANAGQRCEAHGNARSLTNRRRLANGQAVFFSWCVPQATLAHQSFPVGAYDLSNLANLGIGHGAIDGGGG